MFSHCIILGFIITGKIFNVIIPLLCIVLSIILSIVLLCIVLSIVLLCIVLSIILLCIVLSIVLLCIVLSIVLLCIVLSIILLCIISHPKKNAENYLAKKLPTPMRQQFFLGYLLL